MPKKLSKLEYWKKFGPSSRRKTEKLAETLKEIQQLISKDPVEAENKLDTVVDQLFDSIGS